MNASLWRHWNTLAGLADFPTSATPRVDVRETKDSYNLVAELPGYAPEQVQVNVLDGVLELKGEQKAEANSEDRWLVKERQETSFTRQFRLPSDVDTANITAEFRNGLLNLHLPKKEEAKPRTVPIRAA